MFILPLFGMKCLCQTFIQLEKFFNEKKFLFFTIITINYNVSHFKATLEQLEGETRQINGNQEALLRNFYELKELKHVLNSASQFFQEVCFV